MFSVEICQHELGYDRGLPWNTLYPKIKLSQINLYE